MSISAIVTRGYTYSVSLVVTRGYASLAVQYVAAPAARQHTVQRELRVVECRYEDRCISVAAQ